VSMKHLLQIAITEATELRFQACACTRMDPRFAAL
jgi:hypothetical protein